MSHKPRQAFRKSALKPSTLKHDEGTKIVLAPSLDGHDEMYTVLFEKKAEYGKPIYK
ncbi:Uncharacterised protein [Chlamydia abortus]|uniref:Uncharacterized protein n=1 Tax=Paenibacillus residui TaxID=629724 RepID=A0ABW3DAW5_9BACL|nr:hypothetical protein [Paenibacillus sp. 32O-W]SHE13446.1 Uncharacterised protein [Chlamydia abortus]